MQLASFHSGGSLLDSLADPRSAERYYVFFEHAWSRANAADPDLVDELETIPSCVAVRSRTELLVRFDLDRGRGTRDVWELYDLARQPFERTNVYGWARYADDVRVLRRKIAQLNACSTVTGDDPVPLACRTLTAAAQQ